MEQSLKKVPANGTRKYSFIMTCNICLQHFSCSLIFCRLPPEIVSPLHSSKFLNQDLAELQCKSYYGTTYNKCRKQSFTLEYTNHCQQALSPYDSVLL